MFSLDNTRNSLTSYKIEVEKFVENPCRICNRPAKYFHFGVRACSSCKMFFKRNAEREQNAFTCNSNGQCAIDLNNHRNCTYCRLKKCFQSGMTTNKFRPSRSTKSKTKILFQLENQYQSQQLPSLNLIRSDNSLLTKDNWALLSNLCHIYQESQLVSISQRLLDTHQWSPFMNDNSDVLPQQYLTCLYKTTGTYLRLNADLSKLPSDDRSIVLRNAAHHITCLGSPFIMEHYHLLSLNNFYDFMTRNYGKYTVDLQRWTTKYIDPDTILVKLTLSLFALSQTTYSYNPNDSIYLTNPVLIYHIQSKYVDIMWKYLIYKYGYYEAVKRFTNITSWLLATTVFISHCQSLTQHVNDVESLVEQTELNLILDDIDEIISSNT